MPNSAQIHREHDGGEKCQQRHAPVGRGHIQRRAGKRHTNHHCHRAGDDGRQYRIKPRFSDAHNQQADQNFDHRRADDAHLHDAHAVRAVKSSRVSEAVFGVECHGRLHHGDIGKGRAIIHRDFAVGNQQCDNRSQTRSEQGDANVKFGEDGHQHRGREHGQHLLQAQAEHGPDGRGVIGQIAEDISFWSNCDFLGHSLSPLGGYKKREPLKATLHVPKSRNTCPEEVMFEQTPEQVLCRHCARFYANRKLCQGADSCASRVIVCSAVITRA